MELSYCVVNTNGRELLLACLEAIRRTHPPGLEHEILVLDNASDDGSAEAVRGAISREVSRSIERDRRAGQAENNSLLLREARGALCLLLNEDSELLDGAARELLDALGADPRGRGRRARSCVDPDGGPHPLRLAVSRASARRSPRRSSSTAGSSPRAPAATARRQVGWVQSCTMLVRREAAEEVGYLDPDFFVYSEEADFQKRLHDAGWRILHVPARPRRPPRAARHRPLAGGRRRVVAVPPRPRPLHAEAPLAGPWCCCRACCGLVLRAAGARRACPARPRPAHGTGSTPAQALRPGSGEGMREAAEAYNRRLDARGSDAGLRSGPGRGPRRGPPPRRPRARRRRLLLVGLGLGRRRAQAAQRARRSPTGAAARRAPSAPPRAGTRREQDQRVGEPEPPSG